MTTELKRILCPVDFSPGSKQALAYAQDFAQRFNGELHIVHAYDDTAYLSPVPGPIAPMAEFASELRRRLEEQLHQLKDEVEKNGVRTQASLVSGAPYRAILDAARDYKPDLIVLGTHGRTGLAHMLLGSVTERVVRLSEWPVLTVRLRD